MTHPANGLHCRLRPGQRPDKATKIPPCGVILLPGAGFSAPVSFGIFRRPGDRVDIAPSPAPGGIIGAALLFGLFFERYESFHCYFLLPCHRPLRCIGASFLWDCKLCFSPRRHVHVKRQEAAGSFAGTKRLSRRRLLRASIDTGPDSPGRRAKTPPLRLAAGRSGRFHRQRQKPSTPRPAG